jgi:hypothetical protein
MLLGDLLLCDNFSGIKFYKHGTICLELLDWYGKAEIVQEQEL